MQNCQNWLFVWGVSGRYSDERLPNCAEIYCHGMPVAYILHSHYKAVHARPDLKKERTHNSIMGEGSHTSESQPDEDAWHFWTIFLS